MYIKLINFFLAHKWEFEVAAIGLGGITTAQLVYADYFIKVLIGLMTLALLIVKAVRMKNKKAPE